MSWFNSSDYGYDSIGGVSDQYDTDYRDIAHSYQKNIPQPTMVDVNKSIMEFSRQGIENFSQPKKNANAQLQAQSIANGGNGMSTATPMATATSNFASGPYGGDSQWRIKDLEEKNKMLVIFIVLLIVYIIINVQTMPKLQYMWNSPGLAAPLVPPVFKPTAL
jgi:hypothetical protein